MGWLHSHVREEKYVHSRRMLVFLVCENMCTWRASPARALTNNRPYIYMTWMCWTLGWMYRACVLWNFWLMTTQLFCSLLFVAFSVCGTRFDVNKLAELSFLWAANYHGYQRLFQSLTFVCLHLTRSLTWPREMYDCWGPMINHVAL